MNQELNQDSKQINYDEHPRIAEVNGRIRNQDRRVADGVKDGQLTATQASQLRGEESRIKAQEKAEVRANGGYLTKSEQKQLNQELNEDSRQIHAERSN